MPDDTLRARRLLADALNLDAGEVDDAASIESVAAWNSLSHMRLIAALEEALGVELPIDELLQIRSVADIARLIETHATVKASKT